MFRNESNLHQRQRVPRGSNKLLIFSKVQKKPIYTLFYFFNAVLNFQIHLRYIELQRPKAASIRRLLACRRVLLHVCVCLMSTGV